MKKFGKYILMVLSIVVMIFTLAACANNYDSFPSISGGEPNKPTESNGGQVVKQGNKLYFVNGKTDENTANPDDGSVLKGAIVRATIGADGSLSDFVTIVPKNVYAKNKETGGGGGIYIFGNSIYYLTPNNERDKNDTLLNDRLDVMVCNLNGTGTKKLDSIMGLDFEYKFVNGHIAYFKQGTITICKLQDGLPKVKQINDVTGIIMPKTEVYEAGKEYASDYIFYTRNLTEEESKLGYHNNVLGAVKCDGSRNIEIINHDTTFKNSTATANENIVTLKNYLVENDNITIYYTRKDADNILSEKLYSYTFTPTVLAKDKGYFEKEKENEIYDNVVGQFIPYKADTVIEVKDNKIWYYTNNTKEVVVNTVDKDNKGTFSGTIIQLRKEGDADMVYYTTQGGMFKFVLARNNVINPEAPFKIFDGAISSNVFGNELIGDYFYFSNVAKKDYVYRLNVNKTYTKDKLEENDTRLNPEIVAIMTSADKKALEEAEKENK